MEGGRCGVPGIVPGLATPATPVTTTTTTTTRTERRVHWVERGVIWTLAPFVDEWQGLSLNRFLAVGFGVTAVYGRLRLNLPLTGWDVAMGTLSGSLAFGKDLFTVFLTRKDARENRAQTTRETVE